MTGFDSPRTAPDEDRLGVWPLALTIYRTAVSVPPDWSARIGLHGRWGSGKSSLLNFVADIARSHGTPVARFNAWACRTTAEMYRDLLKALAESSLSSSDEPPWRAKVQEFHRLATEQSGSEEQLRDRGRSLLESLLNVVGTDHRTLVLVDDLDRSSPEIVPHLLFAVREILDVPGLSFLLAFDDEAVASALEAYQPGTDGREYLEKIIDFRFRVPIADAPRRAKLLRDDALAYAPFVEPAALDSCSELLPDTPRGVRALARHLHVIGVEAERFDPGELDHTAIVQLILLRQTWPEFWERYVSDSTLRQKILSCMIGLSGRGGGGAEKLDLETLLLTEVPAAEQTERDRLRRIVRRLTMAHAGLNPDAWQTHAWLLERPAPLSGRELDSLHSEWKTLPEALASSVERRATERGLEPSTVVLCAVRLVEHRKAAAFEQARQAVSLAKVNDAIAEFHESLCFQFALAELLDDADEGLAAWIVEQACGRAERPISVATGSLEDGDAQFASRIVELSGSTPADRLRLLQSLSNGFSLARVPDEHVLRERLSELGDKSRAAVASQYLAAIATEAGVEAVAARLGVTQELMLLRDPAFPLWTGPGLEQLTQLANDAASDQAIHRNFFKLYIRLKSALEASEISARDSPLASRDVFDVIFAGATAQPTAPDVHLSLKHDRERLESMFDPSTPGSQDDSEDQDD